MTIIDSAARKDKWGRRTTVMLNSFQHLLPPFLYNLGRVSSYTLIGLALGTSGFFLSGEVLAKSRFRFRRREF